MNMAKRSDLTQPQRTIMVVVLMTGFFSHRFESELAGDRLPNLDALLRRQHLDGSMADDRLFDG